MPDWISHMLIGLIIAHLFKIRRKSLVVLGTLLPDFIIKITTLGFFVSLPLSIYWYLIPAHLPAGLFLITLIITPLFNAPFKKIFWPITIGWLSHVLADMTTKFFIYNPQGMIFFPFTWKSFSYQVLWPEEYYIAIIIFGSIYLAIIINEKLKSRPVIG